MPTLPMQVSGAAGARTPGLTPRFLGCVGLSEERPTDEAQAAAGHVAAEGENDLDGYFVGTWCYGSQGERYSIVRTSSGRLMFEELTAFGVKLHGILHQEGQHLQAELFSSGPCPSMVGTIRVRRPSKPYSRGGVEDVQLASSLRGAGGEWQAEVLARKAEVPQTRPAAGPTARIIAPPHQDNAGAESQKKLRFECTAEDAAGPTPQSHGWGSQNGEQACCATGRAGEQACSGARAPSHVEVQQRLSQLEQENARLRALLLESEQRGRMKEAESGVVTSQLKHCRDKLEGSFTQCKLLSCKLQEAEEDLRRYLAAGLGVMGVSAAPNTASEAGAAPGVATLGARPRVLVTGATGLLGRQVLEAFSDEWHVLGLGLKRARPPVVACDLTQRGAVATHMEQFRPHVVIHLATERRPEEMMKDPARTEKLNVAATLDVAKACKLTGAWLVLLSCDRVFDGSSPPYGVGSQTSPPDEYGRQKARAEALALAEAPGAAVLRVPSLYGPVEFPAESVVTALYAELQAGALQSMAHDRRICFPTWAGDIAALLRKMSDRHQAGADLSGVFHWQGPHALRWPEVLQVMADVAGLELPRGERAAELGSGLPALELPVLGGGHSAQLDCSRLEALLDCSGFRTDLRQGLEKCLLGQPGRPTPVEERLTRQGRLLGVADSIGAVAAAAAAMGCASPGDADGSCPPQPVG